MSQSTALYSSNVCSLVESRQIYIFKTLIFGGLILSVERDTMINSLKHIVIPTLRERGFKGSFPHYHRKLESQTDLLMFQFSQWGGILYVEISKCPLNGSTGYRDQQIPVNKIKVYQIVGNSFNDRYRIGEGFEFSVSVTEEVAKDIQKSLDKAEDWWKEHPNWWND